MRKMENKNEGIETKIGNEERKTKKSSIVKIGLVSLLATALLGLGCEGKPDTTRLCVDGSKRVVADERCEDKDRNGATGTYAGAAANTGSTGTHGGGGISPFMWYYIGNTVGRSYPVGSTVSNGSYIAPAKSSFYSSKGTVVRGGFGHSAVGHGTTGG
jgi:hypothetical protein